MLTSGNHIWDKREIYDYLDRDSRACCGRPTTSMTCPDAATPSFARGTASQVRRDQPAGPHAHAADRLPFP